MKLCSECGTEFSGREWRCPECDWKAAVINGFTALAPDKDQRGDEYDFSGYSCLTEIEDICFWFSGRNRLFQYVLNRYFPKAESMLEIGCGSGNVLKGFSEHFPSIAFAGGDIHTDGLKYARHRLPDADLLQIDACSLPFKNEFDVIGAFDVIEHIEEDEIVLREMFKAVRPGGGIMIAVPQHRWLWTDMDEISMHKRRYERKELTEKIRNAGFVPVWVTSFISLLLPVLLASRLRWKFFKGKQSDISDKIKDDLTLSSPLNRICDLVCTLERQIIKSGFSLPVGGSLLCIGIKETE